MNPTNAAATIRFQSTHPAWGEALAHNGKLEQYIFQSTHPAWGETGQRDRAGADKLISIHSPRVG